MYFYPNECYVCEATDSLKQCSDCKMVSYCGESHQKVDWKNHKTFCRAITTILRKTHQLHIFEKLKGLSRDKWMNESKSMWSEIISLLNRALFPNEEEMLQFPRVCFVCFEARQRLLKNCPNCPFASFCIEHPSSPIHDRDCHEIKTIHDKKVLVIPSKERIQLNILAASLRKSEKSPLSMEDLMDQQFGPGAEIEENVKYYVSEAMSVPLTLYNAFQKLNQPLQSEIVVHVQGVANVHVFVESWESILHLMPSIVSLTIVFIDSKQNSCTNVTLCNKCVLAKRKLIVEVPALPYVKYVKKKSYQKPNLLAMFMIDLYYCTRDKFRVWHENLDYWTTSSCPIVVAYKHNVERFVIENLHPYICNSQLCYMGLNGFSPLYPCLNPYDWTCCKNSMNLIIAKSPRESKKTTTGQVDGTLLEKYQDEDDKDDPDNSIEWKKRLLRRSFYHSVCYVCQAMNPTLACKKCKMIFYCGENHRRVHWPYHKVICRAILGMLNETGATSVFDRLPMDNDKLWLKGKLDLLTKTELKIGKQLVNGEREMFLFPKTCFVCHASDASILKNCKCGISFCKIHLKNADHKEHCKNFSLCRKLMLILEPRVMHLVVKVLPKKTNHYPETIEDFMKNNLKFNAEELSIPNIQNVLLSDYLSRALTFLYCAEYYMDPCYFESDTLIIHVIGATMREKCEADFWKFILYWYNHLKNLQVIFIGPEVETKDTSAQQTLLARFDFSSIAYMRYQNLETKSYAMKYEDYYRREDFVNPDMVVGFNLNLHESEPETWKQAAAVLAKIDSFFIMTAKSKARSYQDDNAMEAILGEIDYYTPAFCNYENPYASLIPERDHETEGLCYSNNCITFCTMIEKRYRSTGKTLTELQLEFHETHRRIARLLLDKKEAKEEAKKLKSKVVNSPTEKLKLAASLEIGNIKIPIFVDATKSARNAEAEVLPRLEPIGVEKSDRKIRKALRRIAQGDGNDENEEIEEKDENEEKEKGSETEKNGKGKVKEEKEGKEVEKEERGGKMKDAKTETEENKEKIEEKKEDEEKPRNEPEEKVKEKKEVKKEENAKQEEKEEKETKIKATKSEICKKAEELKPELEKKTEITKKSETEKNPNTVIETEKKPEIVAKSEIENKSELEKKPEMENEAGSVKPNEEKKGNAEKEKPNSADNLKFVEKPKTEETKIENIEAEDKEEKPKVENIPVGSRKSKNKKQPKSETIISEVNEELSKMKEAEKPKPETEQLDGKKSKMKKQTKTETREKETPTEEANNESPKTSENQIASKKSKNKKSKTDSKEVTEVDSEEKEIAKPEIGNKKSKNKKQLKLEKETIVEDKNIEESQTVKKDENFSNDKVESKKSRKQKVDAKKASLTENVKDEEKGEKSSTENTKKSKQKKQTKIDNENAQKTTLLLERNKLLEEHLFLMRENEKLKMENDKLREESARLRRENSEITDDNENYD